MGSWKKVAKGNNIASLRSLVEDRQLRSGDKLLAVMNLKVPVAWAFNELPFRAAMPPGIKLIDVRGVGLTRVEVEMEATSPYLIPVLAWMSAHWLYLAIAGAVGGLILGVICSGILVYVWEEAGDVIKGATSNLLLLGIPIALGVGVLAYVGHRRGG